MGEYVKIRGIAVPVLNLCTFDFLGLSRHDDVKRVSKEALEKYGCGSCGPRGFYGTIDQHLLFEQAISSFMGTQVTSLPFLPFFLPSFLAFFLFFLFFFF